MSLKNFEGDVVKEKLEELLEEVDELMELDYREGKDRKKKLDTRVENFLKKAFEDWEDKKESYYGPLFAVITGDKSHREKQREYERDLKRRKRNLETWIEEVEMMQEFSIDEKKIDKVEKEIEEAEQEADRRKAVVDQKVGGAYIELIDKLREEMRERESIQEDIIEIKKEVKEVKDALQALTEGMEDERGG